MAELTDERIAEIEARAICATKGPWLGKEGAAEGDQIFAAKGGWIAEVSPLQHQNVRFIAASRQDVPDLIAALRAAREHIAAMRRELVSMYQILVNNDLLVAGCGCDYCSKSRVVVDACPIAAGLSNQDQTDTGGPK
jgi:hypothetical protein